MILGKGALVLYIFMPCHSSCSTKTRDIFVFMAWFLTSSDAHDTLPIGNLQAK